ncbi:MAG: T9SS type A sorting domain-containing protein [Bacteroidia bacterium]|nr:T9SS type A sorting domain-containing protein [Bacteroidia bacterium]
MQSRDFKQNNAGVQQYEVDFNVIREQSITHFYPYPNPFTSSMRFVFTLTGTSVPDAINVKIMTAEGRVVKELNKDDLGDIHVGNNITQWAWDGTDQYGDKLGNGTYFYKVTVKSGGEEVKLRESKGDGSFKEQVGVIYLMR